MKFLRLKFVLAVLPLAMFGCAVRTPAQTSAPAHPALWVVKGPHATVYLFGSAHLLTKDRAWRTPQFDAALASSQDTVA